MLEVRCVGATKLRNQNGQEVMRTPHTLEACLAGGVWGGGGGHSQGCPWSWGECLELTMDRAVLHAKPIVGMGPTMKNQLGVCVIEDIHRDCGCID